MAVQKGMTIPAKQLWNGERFSLSGREGVYVVKTYQDAASNVLTTRAERRLTARIWTWTWSYPGLGRRWKKWDELATPIEVQATDQLVYRFSRLG